MSPISSNVMSVQFDSPNVEGGTLSESRIETVGQEFEAVFLSMMLKEMRNSIEGDGFFAGDSSDSFGGMFDLFIGKHLAESKPLGISEMLTKQYANNQPEVQAALEEGLGQTTSFTA